MLVNTTCCWSWHIFRQCKCVAVGVMQYCDERCQMQSDCGTCLLYGSRYHKCWPLWTFHDLSRCCRKCHNSWIFHGVYFMCSLSVWILITVQLPGCWQQAWNCAENGAVWGPEASIRARWDWQASKQVIHDVVVQLCPEFIDAPHASRKHLGNFASHFVV